MSKLTTKQKRFCEEYIVDFNATQAAIRAGYSVKTARAIAHENLTKPDIQSYVAEFINKITRAVELTVESVLRDIAEIKARCMQKEPVLDSDGEPTGEWTFAYQGALKACELEARYLGMFAADNKRELDMKIGKLTAKDVEKVQGLFDQIVQK